ncbi:protein-glutamate methylesterase/protein-glutamine glutaminase [Methylogaea oryzae]|uniref:Protein-glutamate methylesterase/protein-glutamine glutaminase n=1 Tax=Methylogaea oryzae TaxID=1295382 RepID=A0A8D4VQA3_9GAMM|nr:chemotaxis response regulator protein-glutamate methylesterase [Methylogaea oryzae]BBL71282.1 chemotaxis response regulator protein-glutamate methylesterase 1 [Methylogaea oryzae]
MTIKVLVVDDSALIRNLLSEIINQQHGMKCIGTAPDPLIAREMIKALEPDVLTLDVEMPKMDGLEFLEKLMRLRPMPVLMISTLTEAGSETTLRALELGAVDYISKPKLDIVKGIQAYAEEIANKIRMTAQAKVRKRLVPSDVPRAQSADAVLPKAAGLLGSTEKLLAIGASTGGTEAIKEVLMRMPPDSPGILVTQHMPEQFTGPFAKRLDGLCSLSVKEAEEGDRILPGHVYIAPGHSHLVLARRGANYVVTLDRGPEVMRHRPSVDVLFRSVANVAGKNALAMILTGMGKDGAAGMLELKQAGAYTYAQDEASCVVFGMPKEAIALGGVDEVLPLLEIPGRVIQRLKSMGHGAIRV